MAACVERGVLGCQGAPRPLRMQCRRGSTRRAAQNAQAQCRCHGDGNRRHVITVQPPPGPWHSCAGPRRAQLRAQAGSTGRGGDGVPADSNGSASESERAAAPASSSSGATTARSGNARAVAGEFCIIEGPDALQGFALMQEEEIAANITSRRNRIFLLMEEIRRLRIQQRLRRLEAQHRNREMDEDEEEPAYPSFIPFLPPLTSATLKEYYTAFAALVTCIIVFGGIIAPTLELKLGMGGQSYAEFIEFLGLPPQLSDVDPIVASFSGGAVGVLSALLVVEVNNVKQQEHKKCTYCRGTGYLVCARCSGSGAVHTPGDNAATHHASATPQPSELRCPNCAGSAKVMCPTCLCTGRALATEHDPRIDPFD